MHNRCPVCHAPPGVACVAIVRGRPQESLGYPLMHKARKEMTNLRIKRVYDVKLRLVIMDESDGPEKWDWEDLLDLRTSGESAEVDEVRLVYEEEIPEYP